MVRTPCYDKNGMKKGAWSPEEDEKLKAYIQRYGHWNWRELPKFAGLKRCGKSCRLRWHNYLRPDVKRGNYSKEEDDIIIKLHEELGNKWSVIASKLPGRTDNEIKNHWHTHLKKRVQRNPATSEVNQLSNDVSDCKAKTEPAETMNIHEVAPSLQISESSQVSLEASSIEFSSSISDYELGMGVNWAAEDSVGSSEIFKEPSGDFWTEPFLADNSYMHTGFASPLEDGGFLPPYASHYDDVDFLSQLMQELPKS